MIRIGHIRPPPTVKQYEYVEYRGWGRYKAYTKTSDGHRSFRRHQHRKATILEARMRTYAPLLLQDSANPLS